MVVENVFCEKFTYYSEVLGLPQYEEKRGTVIAGKSYHTRHEKTNTGFVPTYAPRGKKIVSAKFHSKCYGLTGIADEIIELDDRVLLLERKFSSYAHITDKILVQVGLLAVLIEENMNKPVLQAHVIFQKENRREMTVTVDRSVREFAISMLNRTRKTVESGIMPESNFDGRCVNCCYRKICPVGSLNTD